MQFELCTDVSLTVHVCKMVMDGWRHEQLVKLVRANLALHR